MHNTQQTVHTSEHCKGKNDFVIKTCHINGLIKFTKDVFESKLIVFELTLRVA